jgi:hypothetical protein
MIRKNSSGTELARFRVPIIYSPKEKYITRFFSDPDLDREVAISLPRMSFEIGGINYDAARKQNSLLRVAKGDDASRVNTQYMGVPYDINFDLNIYTKNIDDGTHIVEQILPYFNPDYTVTTNLVPDMGFLKDVPIILNSINNNIQYEGNFDAVRYVNWILTFTVKAYFYGPISTPKIIRKSIANIFNDPSLIAGYVTRINTSNGNNGFYKSNDIVYQGNNFNRANAYGTVVSWNPSIGKLVLGGVQGQFKANNIIRATSSNAAYTLASFDVAPIKLAQITVEPDPIDAEIDSDFGYTTTITEWPDTELE